MGSDVRLLTSPVSFLRFCRPSNVMSGDASINVCSTCSCSGISKDCRLLQQACDLRTHAADFRDMHCASQKPSSPSIENEDLSSLQSSSLAVHERARSNPRSQCLRSRWLTISPKDTLVAQSRAYSRYQQWPFTGERERREFGDPC